MAAWSMQEPRRADACDVVIVGAGLVGAAVAARLAHEGYCIAVLEAQLVGGGASGRSAGMVLAGLPGHYNWAVSAYGRRRAREIWALTVEGRERLVEAAERLNVPFERSGSLTLAVAEAEAQALAASEALLQEDGLSGRLLEEEPTGRGFLAALHRPADATIDAGELTRVLLEESGVTVHERTEVYDLEPERDSVRVSAQGRTVLCNAVVLAINGYASLFDPYFADRVAPTRGLIVATQPLDATVLPVPCSADYGYEYCRQLADRRLLLGGWRRPHASSRGTSREAGLGDIVRDGVARFAAGYFPDVDLGGARRWSGTMGFTPDGLPLVGALPHLPQVYFALGFGGRGLAWAFVAAERLVALMMRDADPGILSAQRLSP